MIDIQNLSKSFFDKKIFENINLKFLSGNTYGIIGANGAGKSTFLKIISGEENFSTGIINIENNKRISVLNQNQDAFDELKVIDVVIRGNIELFKIQEEKNAIYENHNSTEKDYERAAQLEELFGQKGGWTAENDAEVLLNGLGINKNKFNLLMKDLKSSEKVKILLAQSLFGEPDILILDEPTNNLDLKAIKWLENFLADYKNLILLVSHDVDFLDQICTHIVDIDFGGAKLYTGNYSFWKESSQLALELTKKQNAKKEEKIKKLKEFVTRFSANASKSSQATSRKKTLEKISLDEIKPSNRKYPYINFNLNREPGKDILKVEDLSYKNSNGEILFSKLNFTINKNEKVALIGPNNLSKTKLLDILMGKEKPNTGTIKWGATITKDYFPKTYNNFFANDLSIIDWLSKWPIHNTQKENKDNSDLRMRSFLGKMIFKGDSVFKKIKDCSGGEKARLLFSKMMLMESNFLAFDQPLNHLDSESIDSFIKAIKNYKSSCIFTTYNRTLIRDTANVILEIKENSSFIFRGSLADYEEKMGY